MSLSESASPTLIRRRRPPEFGRWFARLRGDIDLLAREPGVHADV
jgi:hypothetical protein